MRKADDIFLQIKEGAENFNLMFESEKEKKRNISKYFFLEIYSLRELNFSFSSILNFFNNFFKFEKEIKYNTFLSSIRRAKNTKPKKEIVEDVEKLEICDIEEVETVEKPKKTNVKNEDKIGRKYKATSPFGMLEEMLEKNRSKKEESEC